MILKLSYFILVVISTYPLLTFCTSIAPQNSENSDLLPPNAFEESLRLELYNSTEDSSDSEEFEFDSDELSEEVIINSTSLPPTTIPEVTTVMQPTTAEEDFSVAVAVASNETELESAMTYSPPLPVRSQKDEDIEEKLFLILQNAVRETYSSFRDILGKRHRDQLHKIETELRSKISQLDVDLNVKIVALDTTTHSRIQSLTDLLADGRRTDIQTFSDNLHQIQKTHQMHIDSQKVEIQQLQVTMDLLNKAQSSLSTKMSQLQKTVNNMDSKINEMVIKTSEDLGTIQDTQKTLSVLVDEIEKDLRTSESEVELMRTDVDGLKKAATEDHHKLRRTMIRDQKHEPIQNSIRHLKNKNVGGALKQWRAIEAIADDLKETLPGDISKIIDESYGKNTGNLLPVLDFIHRAVSHGDRRLKEAAYSSLMQDMDMSKQINDQKRTNEMFHLAQTMKTDLGGYYNTSATTAEIAGKLPEIVRLMTFDKTKLVLPTRGYLRVAADRKVTLVPQDGRFYDKEEVLWTFEYDKDKADGTFFIKSEKLQKYLVTLHEGFNSYGFSKQGLFVTGNKKENGTRFQVTIINNGEFVLLKAVFFNGYLTWKSNIQTIYGDDDSYFLLLVDRKNGPSPFWIIEGEN